MQAKGDDHVLIRQAKSSEFFLLKEQRLSSYQPYKEVLTPEHWEMLKANLASTNDQDPGVEVFVAEIDGHIAGSVALFPAESIAYGWDTQKIEYPEIRMLAVSAEFRSRGVGKTLVEHCIDISKIRRQKFVGLHTGSFMENAIALYEKMGFQRVPQLDFAPLDDGIVVQAFRYNL